MANATLTILDQNGNEIFSEVTALNEGQNVQQFMESAVNLVANDQLLTFGAQYYGTFQPTPPGPLGYLINMINGFYDAPDSGTYWEFIYDGEACMTGIDFVFPADGSTVVFQQTRYSSASSAQLKNKHAFHHGKQD